MRDLLTLCQDVTDRIGELRPSTVATNNDPDARRLLATANRVGRELARKNWAVLTKERTITTTSGTTEYSLPSDYARNISDTAWDATNLWQMRGSMTPQDWQFLKNSVVTRSDILLSYRIVRGTSGATRKFALDPAPTGSGRIRS